MKSRHWGFLFCVIVGLTSVVRFCWQGERERLNDRIAINPIGSEAPRPVSLVPRPDPVPRSVSQAMKPLLDDAAPVQPNGISLMPPADEQWQHPLPHDVPIAVVGGADGMRGNRHIAAPMGTPLSNLHVKLLNRQRAAVFDDFF